MINKIISFAFLLQIITCCDYIYFREASRFLKEGRFELARKKYMLRLPDIRDVQKKAWLNFMIGKTYEGEKKFIDAEKFYDLSFQDNPEDILTVRALLRVYLKNSRYNEIIKLCEKLITIKAFEKDRAIFYIYLCRAYSGLNIFSKAESLCGKVLDGNYSDRFKAIAYYFMGDMNLNKLGSRDIGLRQLEKATMLDPDYVEPYVALAIEYSNMKKYSEAKKYFIKSVSLSADRPEVYYNLGQIYQLEEDIDRALELYTEALKLDGELLEAHLKLAIIFTEKGNYAFARYHLNKIQMTEPSFAPVDKYFGKIFLLENNYTMAIHMLKRGLGRFPGDEEALYYLSIAYGNDGNYAESLNALLKLKKINSNYRDLYSKIGDIYLIMGNRHKAYNFYNREIKRDEMSASAIIGLVKLEASSKKPSYKKIINLLKKALKSGFKDIEGLIKSPYMRSVIKDEKIIEVLGVKKISG